MTCCSTFKALMGALGLATTVGLAVDASAFSGLPGDAMAVPRDAAPLLELARDRVRDHRRDPAGSDAPAGRPGGIKPKPGISVGPTPPPKKSNGSGWQKKYPSNY